MSYRNACFSKVSRWDVLPDDPWMSAGYPSRKFSLWAVFSTRALSLSNHKSHGGEENPGIGINFPKRQCTLSCQELLPGDFITRSTIPVQSRQTTVNKTTCVCRMQLEVPENPTHTYPPPGMITKRFPDNFIP